MHNNNNIIKKQPEETEQWQLSLADMMTLLLCFFVLITAVSSIDKTRYAEIAEVMETAMGVESETVLQQQESMQDIKEKLEEAIGHQSSEIHLELRPDSVAINLTGGVFFKLGSADLTLLAIDILKRIADSLLSVSFRITVEGHTDNLPIRSVVFPSNWELSSARASAVARIIINRGFPKTKVKVLGLADTNPIYPNEDENGDSIPENQAQNRRVVILVTP